MDDFIGKITDFIRSEAKTETVVGQQFKLGEFTCVPVIAFGMGFGGGEGGGEGEGTGIISKSGKGKGEGMGGGAGMGVSPLGFLVTRGDQISFVSTKSGRGLSAVFEKMPDMLEKYFNAKKKTPAEEVV